MKNFGGDAGELIRQFIAKIEKLEEDKANIAEDIGETYKDTKMRGLDPKIIRKIISLRKQDPDKRAEEEEIMDMYMHALGMIEQSQHQEEREEEYA